MLYLAIGEGIIILGLVVFLFVLKSKNAALMANLEYLKNENAALSEKIKTLEEYEKKSLVLEEKLKNIRQNENFAKEIFENIANSVMEKTAEKTQKEISRILNPVEEDIEEFRRRIDEIFMIETKTFGELFNELRNLKVLNENLTKEAQNLANALKNQSKMQGSWGELVLERVLELSGLRKGIEYKREVTMGNYRPDVVIYLPDNKKIIIDAKTSLKDYVEYINTGDENSLKKHIASIRNHIKTLAAKNYEELVKSEFVFMFIPIDGALNAALQKDPYLYEEAFKNKIVLISPATLLPVLRIVESIWRFERQNENIKEVLSLTENLYDKLRLFMEEYEKLGRNIENSKEMYEKSSKRIKETIIPKIEEIKTVSGIKPKKEIK
jgi:DNA recombination protein RmuC